MKLTPERRAELLNELKLRELFRDKCLCRRYGVSRSMLGRLRREALYGVKRSTLGKVLGEMTQNESTGDFHLIMIPYKRPPKVKA